MDEDRLLLEARPSWWAFFWHFVFGWLIIPLIVALVKRASLVLRVYPNRVVLETGLLSKNTAELFCSDIRLVNVRQGLLGRIVGIGHVAFTSTGDMPEQVAFGIPNPQKVKDLVMARKKAASRPGN